LIRARKYFGGESVAKKIRDLDGVSRGGEIFRVDPKKIVVKKGWNPRTDFSGEEELRDSIIANGVQVPVHVWRDKDDDIVLINGERRLRAALLAIEEGYPIPSIPAIFVRPDISQTEILIMSLVTNQGKPLDPVEEAEAIRRLVAWGMPISDVATRLGKSISLVRQRLKLVDALPAVKDAVQAGEIGVVDALGIVSSDPVEQQEKLEEQKEKRQNKRRRTPVEIVIDKAKTLTPGELREIVETISKWIEG
jgi:ParB family chromosome partitioning protein